MKPEEQAEIKIWDWLNKRSDKIKEIYFNRKNKINAPIFQTKGNNKKPDFILLIDNGCNGEYAAVEVKPIGRSRTIYDAGKIIDYYKNYINGKTKYYINKKEIKINHFAIATDNSEEGFLFKKQYEDKVKENKGYLVRLGLLPKYEHIGTMRFLRKLWSDFDRERKLLNITKTKSPSLGILMSNPQIDNKPHLLTVIYVDWLNKKPGWGQRFIKL